MASRKGGYSKMRVTARRRKKKDSIGRYILVAIVLLVLVVAAVLVIGGSKKKSKPKSKTAQVKSSKKKLKKSSKAKAGKLAKRGRRSRKKMEKVKKRRVRRSKGKRTRRTKKGGHTRKKKTAAYKVEAILVDDSGQRFVMVGDRQLKPGDKIGGRRIIQISANEVKVEYHGKTYSVRIGQDLY
ncbi:hypothetical protein CH330_09625 [candidate division WOR-3 bacterium JGI_Cruoil_03_51_56]|uniref:Uncharacterized protein n=1 Tax=candidate division WOR-3 bacterium JGI_Cruoil_03_51_56 TaxID=1973747 RepID=A0A235BPA6_UNCW3|nr:MAG: hypothetical protein CH330_09625 [candidate division WOR-3 bacterium JGI_Cruoil_03_51_56]